MAYDTKGTGKRKHHTAGQERDYMANVMKGEFFEVLVAIAGREGTQRLQLEQKRESIRQAKRLLSEGGFGSAAAVTYVVPREDKADKRTLIWQGSVRFSSRGNPVVRVDEL